MRARYPDDLLAVRRRNAQFAAAAEWLFVLADLVALRQIGIEVVLAREDRVLRDLAAEREAELDRVLDRPLVRHGQRSRMRQADGAGARVLRRAVLELAPAEHLGSSLEVRVPLEADARFVLRQRPRASPSPRAVPAPCPRAPRPSRRGARAAPSSR